ncbi:MAG: hypothetical protein GX847_01340 [Clostridiales bacterium]|nr:hypothetical protein [Clostridiales bacterium]
MKERCFIHMSLSAIRSITEAEEAARKAKLEAQAKMKRDIEQAEQEGQEAITSSLAQAEGEIRHLRRESELKAEEFAKNLASNTSNKCAAIVARAETMLDAAADLIAERIVGG